MTLISNIPITCTPWLVDLLELRPSKYFLFGLKHVADAIHMLNNNILQLTVLKYTFTGGSGWVVLD